MSQNNTVPYGIRREDIYSKTREDDRVRRFMTPQRILWTSQGEQCPVRGAEYLLEDRDPQINLMQGTQPACVLENKGAPAGILLDFGVEFHGYVKLFIWSVSKPAVRIRVRFGESAMEAMSELGGQKNATNDHINRDQEFLAGMLSMNEIGPSGFRFVRIDLLEENASVSFKAIKGIFTYRELEYKGSFRSNDQRLNTIWDTGAYTVHLNMQEYVWDGIKRDRLVWIGDMHPETSTIQAVFGYDKSVPASLDLARQEAPLPEFMSTISSYSIWWVMIQYGWYMQNGDKAYLESNQAYLTALLRQLAAYVDENGSETMPESRFVDWPTKGSDNLPAVHAGLQALLCWCMQVGEKLCLELDDADCAALCAATAKKLKTHRPDPNGNKQAAAFLALSGIADYQEMNDNVIKKDGAKHLSTFLGYYVLQAQALAGDIQGALNNIRQYWGGMLDRGATTFWEDFNLDWLEGSGRIDELVKDGEKDLHGDYGAFCYIGFRHSLCHGWASGPTAFLSEYVLGIKPVAPGCKKVRIHPMLGDLQWVEGTYPTPYGILSVRHEKQADGTIVSTIQAPPEVEVLRDGE